MKIACVVPRYAPCIGGVEIHVDRLARRDARQRHVVAVLIQETDHSLLEREDLNGVTVRTCHAALSAHNYTLAPRSMSVSPRERPAMHRPPHRQRTDLFPAPG
jgi:hypothetical protein